MQNLFIDTIGAPACLEQLAEEASELAQAALKAARVLRGENPTPMSEKEAKANLIEEAADVRLCLRVLEDFIGMESTRDIEDRKAERWRNRLLGTTE